MAFEGPFPQQPDVAIASYAYEDIEEGTGLVEYILYTDEKDGATGTGETLGYKLGRATHEVGDTTGASGSRYSYIGGGNTRTFSVTFNSPRTMRGNAHFNFSVHTSNAGTADLTGTATLQLNGVSVATETFRIPSNSYLKTKNLLLVIPSTKIRSGDTLSLVLSATGTAPYPLVYHDPKDRDQGSDTRGGWGAGTWSAVTAATNPTKSSIFIPFELNQ